MNKVVINSKNINLKQIANEWLEAQKKVLKKIHLLCIKVKFINI